jgi:hypothetical protein
LILCKHPLYINGETADDMREKLINHKEFKFDQPIS